MSIDRVGLFGPLRRALITGLAGSFLLALLTPAFATPVGAAAAESGLRLYTAGGQDSGNAPQLQTDVAIRVAGVLARVKVAQRFRNPGAAWVEGIYVFPLPEDAAVDRLRMRYAGRLIEGEIQEKQQARQTYEAARERGRGATLLDQQRANVFTTALANIPPGGEVQIEIEYQQTVRWADGEFSLRFPMVVGPRYISGTPLVGESGTYPAGYGWAHDTDEVPDASRITPPVLVGADDNFNPLALQADLDIGLPLSEIGSPYHPVTVEQAAPGRYRVALATGSVPAERDFVLRWRPAAAQQPGAALFAEAWRDRHYGLLMLMPPAPGAQPQGVARELILVIDTSGSMHGDSIAQARAAVLRALQLLRPGDRFNVIRFSDRAQALFEHAVPVGPGSLERARRYVSGLQAEGGTEMLSAMNLALCDPRPSGLLRQVVFLTDGAVGNEAALFKAIADLIGDSRLFTVGIGSAPNALFMTKAAAFGRGTFTYIGHAAEVADKVGALFGKLGAPVLTDVRVRWFGAGGEIAAEQAPRAVPDLYAGEPLVLAVQTQDIPQRVEIEGRFGEQDWRHAVTLASGASGAGVHALWARRMIDDWLARPVIGEDREVVHTAVLALAMQHHLVSRHTSLVAVDRTPGRPTASGLQSSAVPTRWSADAVFGRLPSSATPAALYLLIGLSALAAWLTARRRV